MDTKKESSTLNSTMPTVSSQSKDSLSQTHGFWKNLFFGLLYALGAYILGGTLLPFHARPFGMAFLGASDRRVPYIYMQDFAFRHGLALNAGF